MRKIDVFEAYLDDYGLIHAYLAKRFYNGESKVFYLKNSRNELVTCEIISQRRQDNYVKYGLKIDPKFIVIGDEYTLIEEHALQVGLQYGLIVRTEKFNQDFQNFREDYGSIIKNGVTTFVLWAPTAQKVQLHLYAPSGLQILEMNKQDRGVFEVKVLENCHGYLYQYEVHVNQKINLVCDPHAYSSDSNSKRSCVVDFDQLDLSFHDECLPKLNSICDARILEVHVRDFSIHPDTDIVHKGKFLGMIEQERKDIYGNKVGFDYLKQLHPTHIQLMPVFDFASVDEDNPSLFYNWGYDPVHFNALEGSYSTNPNDPLCRIKEFARLIGFYHQNGIRVNLDVVYNHMYDMERSHFDQIVPYYYFRYGKEGEISNGSFCGNDVDSTNSMVRHFIKLSLKHMITHYHIDGVRFDLMGILDIETMNVLVDMTHQLRDNFFIYGEGWNMPTLLDESKRASMHNAHLMPNISFFNDFYRDHVKGPTASDRVWEKGYLLGDAYYKEAFVASVLGTSTNQGCVKLFNHPGQSINYLECHDNHTLWDKICLSCMEDDFSVKKAKLKLSLAALFISQGVVFTQLGQEMGRTKHGEANTYRSLDTVNQIDYSRQQEFSDVIEYYQQLIQLRERFDCFRLTDKNEIDQKIGVEYLEHGIVKIDYEDQLEIYFNPFSISYLIEKDQEVRVVFDDLGWCQQRVTSLQINPYSMIICRKREYEN